ncbi:MAG: OmpA family protein [Rhodospirillales bacterium]|jgi:chemotaxis protein MotB|nr:OmpA family protein [Rhodospirillales bacterium]
MAVKRLIPPPPDTEEDDADAWLITYADAVTLLMAFFIMLVSFAKIDIPIYEQVKAGILDQLGKKGDAAKEQSPIALLKVDLQDVVFAMQADQAVTVGTDSRGVVMELDSSAFFRPGSADIREAAFPILFNMATTLMAPRYEPFIIEVEGHTDDDPISTLRFPSNWELSAGRASAVVRLFMTQGLAGDKMKAVGYGETRPKLPNRSADGAPIPENQAINRRVVVRISPMSLEERDAYFERRSHEAMAAGDFSEGRPPSPEDRTP